MRRPFVNSTAAAAMLSAVFVAFVQASPAPDVPEKNNRPRKVIHLSAVFSEDDDNPGDVAFDVSGVSAGLGLDLIPGRLDGLQIAVLCAGAESYRGLQIGILASLSGTGKGIQASGFANFIHHRFEGIQLAGWENAASGVGAQISIVENRTDDCLNLTDAFRNDGRESEWGGLQLAGFSNAACWMDGVQASLVYNGAVRCRGVQLSAWNDAEELRGLQLGLINETRSASGVQIGAVNRTGQLHGVQLGVFNWADSGSGVQIGLVNGFGTSPEIMAYPLFYLHF